MAAPYRSAGQPYATDRRLPPPAEVGGCRQFIVNSISPGGGPGRSCYSVAPEDALAAPRAAVRRCARAARARSSAWRRFSSTTGSVIGLRLLGGAAGPCV